MNLHQSLMKLLSIIFILLLTNTSVLAQDQTDYYKQNLVEVERVEDNLTSYKERRQNSGAYFSLAYMDLVFQNYISSDKTRTYKALFGSSGIPFFQLSVDYKINGELGAMTLGLEYGSGSISSNESGIDTKLTFTQYAFGIKILGDMFWDEPYAVPYVGLGLLNMDFSEVQPSSSSSESTTGFNYSLGVLLQVDWIDYQTAKLATFNWGIENSFIDLYAKKYLNSKVKDNSNTETEFLFGAGVRLEF